MKEHVRVLLVEDDEDDYVMTQELLEQTQGFKVSLDWASDFKGGLDMIRRSDHDIYLVDYRLGGRDGMDLITKVQSEEATGPFILLTGQGDQELESAALSAGLDDYLRKEGLGVVELERSIRYAIERHRIRTELAQSQSRESEMKSEFMSHVSHELRTPIAVIHQFVSIIQDGLAGDPTPQQQEYLTIIQSNIDQLTHMVTQLLEVTRAEVGKLSIDPAQQSVAALLGEVRSYFGPAASASGLDFAVEIPDDDIDVFADNVRFRQVCGNLVENAFKFTPSGGSVAVRAALVDGDFVRFDVSDTGIGIPVDRLDGIFDRLSQANNAPVESSRKGLGLGLYIAKELVDRHGGQLWVTSGEGEGATFSFTLPVWSLAKVLAPVADRAAQLGLPVLLFEICISGDRGRGRKRQLFRQEAERAVKNLAFRGDMVIPALRNAIRPGSLYFAVIADATDAPSIARRISEELALLSVVRAGGVSPEVCFEVASQSRKYPASGDVDPAVILARNVERLVCGSPEVIGRKDSSVT